MWAGVFSFLSTFFVKLLASLRPSAEEKLGRAEEKLAVAEAHRERAERVAKAGTALSPVLSDPDRLREFQARDPNNRDN